MRLAELLAEAVSMDEISALQRMPLADAKRSASNMIDREVPLAKAEKRADLKARISGAGSTGAIMAILTNMLLSQQGMGMGGGTVKTKKGIGYPR